MKPAIYKVMVLVALLTISVSTLYAQQTGTRFTVPFSFVVNGQTLPPGDYFIEGLWWNAVAFHNLKGEPSLVVMEQYGPVHRSQNQAGFPPLWHSLCFGVGRVAQHEPRSRIPD